MNIKNLNLLLIPAAFIVPIKANAIEYLNIEQAKKIIFPGANEFEKIELRLSKQQIEEINEQSPIPLDEAELLIWKVSKDKTCLGYFVINDVIGKHEYITFAIGLDRNGAILSLEILQYREDHGQEVSREEWRKQFVNKNLNSDFKLDRGITNISGATLSCKHLIAAIQRLLTIHKVAFNNDAL